MDSNAVFIELTAVDYSRKLIIAVANISHVRQGQRGEVHIVLLSSPNGVIPVIDTYGDICAKLTREGAIIIIK